MKSLLTRVSEFRSSQLLGSNSPLSALKNFRYETIKDGDQAILWNKDGSSELIVGPARPWLGNGASVSKLVQYHANEENYLEIEYKNGRIERKSGPVSMFKDPRIHASIHHKNKQKIEPNSAIVVYYQDDQDNVVSKGTHDMKRRILYGPMIYTPNEKGIEYFHWFQWHYPTNEETRGLTFQGKVNFIKIGLNSTHFYFDIENVRTKDDVLITVKSMIFYKIKRLEDMLDGTSDPINVMINSIIADVIEYASTVTFEQFKQNYHELNATIDESTYDTANANKNNNNNNNNALNLGHGTIYNQLIGKSHQIGIEISKIVFRGYTASDSLQRIQDSSIDTRIQLEMKQNAQKLELEMKDKYHLKNMQWKQSQFDLELSHLKLMNQEKQQHYQILNSTINDNIADIIRAETNSPENKKIIQIEYPKDGKQNDKDNKTDPLVLETIE